MTSDKLMVLDCTLRDGGYYNNWDFAPETVNRYLHAVAAAGIDVVEIGFRFAPKNEFLGACAYSTDRFLERQSLPQNALIGVMLNAKDVLEAPGNSDDAVEVFQFRARNESMVGLVRIAAHLSEVQPCRQFVEKLKALGYLVGINVMQAGSISADDMTSVAAEVAGWGCVDVFYFADSLGNMTAADMRSTISAIESGWDGPIGVHAHNNMGRAVVNTLEAIDRGALWVDATICGMGRGAGNTPMEYLLLELVRSGCNTYKCDALFPLVLNEFKALQDEYGWGTNILYFLSGSYGIHPTYVQEMLSRDSDDTDDAIAALEQLRGTGAKSFNAARLDAAMSTNDVDFPGQWSAQNWADGHPILIVGAGPWVQKNVESLVAFIDDARPIVICLNTNPPLPPEKISAFAACHEIRFAMEAEHYQDLQSPLIAPAAAFPNLPQSTLLPDRIMDYGMTVKPGCFWADDTRCVIPKRLVAAYAMAFANAAGASEILLAGFDGYEAANPLQQEMQMVFDCYETTGQLVPIIAVTPTTYAIHRSSIFSPER